MLYAAVGTAIGIVLSLIYLQQARSGIDPATLRSVLQVVFACLLVLTAFIAWYFVLAGENQRAAEEESDRPTIMLIEEIEAHGKKIGRASGRERVGQDVEISVGAGTIKKK